MALGNVLGLLGLLSIVALILIYIIRPNYPQHFVSSTMIWKLSLRYQKKKIPISKIKNILLIVCQILILVALALILARPPILSGKDAENSEKIIIIDASASMTAVNGHDSTATTRFERAVTDAKALVDAVFKANGTVSVIFAGPEALLSVRRAKAAARQEVYAALSNYTCSYGAADIEGAMKYAEDIIADALEIMHYTPEVVFYTGKKYLSANDVTVVDVSDADEWNAAILGGRASLNASSTYNFAVDVAVYGRDATVRVGFDIYGVNGTDTSISLFKFGTCINDETVTVTLDTSEEIDDEYSSSSGTDTNVVYSYDYVRAYIAGIDNIDVSAGAVNDSISEDDEYYFYGGKKHELNIQYASTLPNPFINSVISSWRTAVRADWDIIPKEVGRDAEPEYSGYDVYIFEHRLPPTMIDDGLVILLDPVGTRAPEGSGLSIGEPKRTTRDNPFYFAPTGVTHPILDNIKPNDIWVTRYTPVRGDESYIELMLCGNDPVMLLRNEPDSKVLVMSIDVNNSNAGLPFAFSLMMLDVFDYFFPGTVSNYLYEVGDTVSFNSVASTMKLVTSTGIELEYDAFPGKYHCYEPGTYTLTQTLISGKKLTTNFYVKLPDAESNITAIEFTLMGPYIDKSLSTMNDVDLILYLAIALVVLLFAEWWLHSATQF